MTLGRRLLRLTLLSAALCAAVGAVAQPAPQPEAGVVDLRQIRPLLQPNLEDLDEDVRRSLSDQRQSADRLLSEVQTEAEAGRRVDTAPAAMAFGKLGALYFLYDRPAAALPALANAAVLQPDSVRWPYLAGFVHQSLGETEAAAAGYRRAAELVPDFAPVHLRRGELALADGDPGVAAEALRRALELEPDCALCAFLLGRAEAALGRPGEAVQLYRRALASQPGADQVYYPLGLALRDAGDLEAAEEALGRVGDTPPAFPDPVLAWVRSLASGASSHFARGRRALDSGDLETAVAELRRGVQADPDHVPLRRALALALRRSGRSDEAVEQYAEAVRRDPSDALGHKELGIILLETGRLAPAARAFATALELEPDLAEAALGLGLAYARAGQPTRALPYLDRAVELAPDDPDARFERAMQLAAAGRVGEAIPELRRVVEATNRPGARLNLGILLEMQGDLAAARGELERVAAEDDGERAARAHLALGRLDERAGDPQAARRRYRAALDLDPDQTRARLRLASLEAAAGALEEAAAGYGAVLQAVPAEREARLAHATSLMFLGRDGEAAASLEAGLEALPGDPFLSYQLALLRAASEDPEVRDARRALELARDAYTAAPTPLHAQALVLAHAQAGDFEAAIRAQSRSLKVWPEDDPRRAAALARLAELRRSRVPQNPWSRDPRLLYRPTVPLPPAAGGEGENPTAGAPPP